MKYKEVIDPIYSKLPVPEGSWRSGKERNAQIVIDDIQVSRVTLPKTKGGGKDIPNPTLNSIRKQLLLRWDEFADFLACPMTRTDYISKIKTKYPNLFQPPD